MSYEPTTPRAIELLLSERFTAFSAGLLHAQTIADQLGAPLVEVQTCLSEFLQGGLLEEQPTQGELGLTYKTTHLAWQTRERLLRARGLRHPALTSPRDFDLRDLIIAVIKAGHIFNGRIRSAGFLAGSTSCSLQHLTLYISEYDGAEIEKVCDELVDQRMLVRREGTFDLGVLGHKIYDGEVRERLHLGQDEAILDYVLKKSIAVFYAWQSEYNRSRSAIGDVLPDVVADLSKLPGIVRPLEIVMATDAGDGAVRIDQQLLERVKKAEFFVGDMTPVFAYERRLRANDNVLVEVGYALASKPPDQIILLAMKRDDLTEGNPQVAFDVATVRRHEFDSKDGLRKRLRTELETVLRKRGWLR